MKNLFNLFLISTLCLFTSTLKSQDESLLDSLMMAKVLDSIAKSYTWQTGSITLENGMATINLPANMRFLDAKQSDQVLTELWGNPPRENKALGMIFPDGKNPLSTDVIAFIVTWDPMGYVKDDDADKIDYNDLLANLKKEAQEASKEREKLGYESIEIIGWAAAPYYDKNTKVLHWAKEIKFGDGESGNTLNYDVRVLGRKGVLSMNAIGDITALEAAKGMIPSVISSVSFGEGHRYADFDSKVDDVAAWTIGGLVAGKVLAKAGFFAIILKFLKPILIGLIALGSLVWRFITGRKKEDEPEVADTKTESETPEEKQGPGQYNV